MTDIYRKIIHLKAALAFDFQLLESIPYEEHDLKPDYIITQTQFIRREN